VFRDKFQPTHSLASRTSGKLTLHNHEKAPAPMISDIRVKAYSSVKAAVRAYSRDPNLDNAAEVEAAWQLVRRLDAVSVWRHSRLSSLGSEAED